MVQSQLLHPSNAFYWMVDIENDVFMASSRPKSV